MTRILITGGGGFIGSHLARTLYQQGHFVRIADVKFDDYIQEKYCTEKIDIDLRVWENCVKATEGIERVYNLAANMGGIGFITEVGAEVMHDNTLINTFMLEASIQNKVKRYLFTSSACIYPTYRQKDPRIKGLREEDAYPADPDNFYGWEKLYTEKMCEAYQRDYKMDIRVLRYHNIYGPEGTYKGGREKARVRVRHSYTSKQFLSVFNISMRISCIASCRTFCFDRACIIFFVHDRDHLYGRSHCAHCD